MIIIIKILHKINRKLFFLNYNLLQYIRKLLNINQRVLVGKLTLDLPPHHLFSLYQKLYKKYDKFLINLTKNFKKNESIIDIGANVGDTLYEFLKINKRPNFYCIEGDKFFFSYLNLNINKIKPNIKSNIFSINELVGSNLKGNLVGKGGTKFLIKHKKGIKTKSLDLIVRENKIVNIKLVKIDVDGYDYNVIESGLGILKKNKPIIYFEFMLIEKDSLAHYKRIIIKLEKLGYKTWTLLDNYGNTIFKNQTTKHLLSFIKYSKLGDLYDVACHIKKIK